MRTLILNQSNIVPGTNNSVLEFTFIGGNVTLMKGQKVALATLQMYYSTFNISALNQNNTFSYYWWNAAGTAFVEQAITIPDGFYDAIALNNYLHFEMIQRQHYLIDNDNGNFVYFIGLTPNPTQYKIEVNVYPMNQDLYPKDETAPYTAGTFRRPSTTVSWDIPSIGLYLTPALEIYQNKLRDVLGLEAGFYPQGPPTYAVQTFPGAYTQLPSYTTPQAYLSTTVPQVTPLSSFLLNCNLINNDYAVPSSLLYSFAPEGAFGEQFTIAPNEYIFIDCLPAQYNKLQIRITDQNGLPIAIEDPNMVIQILITDPETDTEHQAEIMIRDAMKTFAPTGIGRSRG